MAMIRDLGWWYWAATVVFLAAGLSGRQWGIWLAMVLCVVQIGHVAWLTRNPTAFALQVRVAYLGLLIAGMRGPLQWIHWGQLAGTSARVLVGYCLLARALSLAPWNRWQPLTPALIKRTFLSIRAAVPPCGEVFRRMSLERVQG
jgi:hypothetical protein